MEPTFKKLSKKELFKEIKDLKLDGEFSIVLTDENIEPLYIGVKKVNIFDIPSILVGAYGGDVNITSYSNDSRFVDNELDRLYNDILVEYDATEEQIHIEIIND